MCGIIGYTGTEYAKDIIIEGLSTLEYRGYDSAGVALGGDSISIYKKSGRVSQLNDLIPNSFSKIGIGHTRWATHGAPTSRNAHPHLSFDGTIAIVHNGIIENCDVLKKEITSRGITFQSDTDSEIIAHLLALEDQSNMVQAVENVAKKIEGSSSFLAIRKGDDNIYCHKKNAALTIGIGLDGNYIASDMLALADHTKKGIVLSDDETAILSKDSVSVYKDGVKIKKQLIDISCKPPKICPCYMQAEIDEIPTALQNTYDSFYSTIKKECIEDIKKAERIAIIACGTAYHAGLYGKEVIEILANKPCEVYIGSEYDRARFISSKTFAIFISQSGETADTLAAVNRSKELGAKTLSITNVANSSITFLTDYALILEAGPEIAVAATKSYNSQLLMLYLLANELAGKKVDKEVVKKLAEEAAMLSTHSIFTESMAKDNLFFIGKGIDELSAMEGALKFKEITYKMAEAYPAGELKHGTIALMDKHCTVIALATNEKDKQKLTVSVSEIKARHAKTIGISAVGEIGCDISLFLPKLSDPLLYPILSIIPMQLLSLSTSFHLGINPDKPRNLAKSVTVV